MIIIRKDCYFIKIMGGSTHCLHRKMDNLFWADWRMFCFPRCSMLSTILSSVVEREIKCNSPDNIVHNIEQSWQLNIILGCFQQPQQVARFMQYT